MIKEIPTEMIPWLHSALATVDIINPYFNINLVTYGAKDTNVSTWIVENNLGQTSAAIYLYYDTAQIATLTEVGEFECREISDFLERKGIRMVSGRKSTISGIATKASSLPLVTEGVLMTLTMSSPAAKDVILASRSALRKVAELIRSDSDIGTNYETNTLARQLLERSARFGCRTYMVLEGGQVVSCMTTYAESGDCAVLGGLITHPSARGKGHARKVLNTLASALLAEGKAAYLYCYKPRLIAWYEANGWSVVSQCAKAEWHQVSS